jgi:hypothetical protein
MLMLSFATRMECPHCMEAFSAWFQAEAAPDTDARYLVRCPKHAGPFVLPVSVFTPVDEVPVGAAPAHRVTGFSEPRQNCPKILDLRLEPPDPSKPPPASPKPRWWQFWKRG